jgi:hypothetical protein
MVCPGIVGFSGTFPFRRGGLSRFYRPNKDVLLLPEDFLPELWGFSGHFPFAVRFVPV